MKRKPKLRTKDEILEDFRGSTQKELISSKRSLLSKYATLFVGKKGIWSLLKYETITFCFSRIPGALGLFLRKIFYRFLLGNLGKGVVLGRCVTLRHPHKIHIGDNTFIDDFAVLDAKGESNEGIRIGQNAYLGRNAILSCKEGSIFLDDYCNISANCSLLSETEIRLGKYCFLAGNCYLVAGGNHNFEKTSVPIMFQPSFSKGGIKVGEDVWLGAGVIVLDDVAIGKGCVVGAGGVVIESLPEYGIAVGSPARPVKDRRAQRDSEPA
jgi:acetyltransferase-like isoleucine patch superfamily enzyme